MEGGGDRRATRRDTSLEAVGGQFSALGRAMKGALPDAGAAEGRGRPRAVVASRAARTAPPWTSWPGPCRRWPIGPGDVVKDEGVAEVRTEGRTGRRDRPSVARRRPGGQRG